MSTVKGVGKKISREGATEKRSKNIQKKTENSAIEPLPGGGGDGKKTEK